MILSDFSFPKKNFEYHVHKNVHKYDYTLIQEEKLMNLNYFIPSKTIRSYYNSINYEITPLHAAHVIYKNYYKNYRDRHIDWLNLIQNSSDVILNYSVIGITSLHSLLIKFISLENKQYDDFFKYDPDSVYILLCREYDEDNYHTYYEGTYRHIDNCLDDLIDLLNGDISFDLEYSELLKRICIQVSKNNQYIIQKNKIDNTESFIEIYIDELGVSYFNNIVPGMDEIREFFYENIFYYPIPFRKGEILTSIRNPESKFIYKGRIRNKMDIKCYCISENGKIFECPCNPFFLEKDNKKYDVRSIPGAFSRYIKKKISIVDFLNVYDTQRKILDNKLNELEI